MTNIQVDFNWYEHTFDDSTLMKYGSPHFSSKDAGDILSEIVNTGKSTVVEGKFLDFQRAQIICANEVFPEAAVADPIADLEVWNEWRSGVRTFPYPGQYSRLGLWKQESKTPSNISTGVMGEIMTGLFGQSVVAPWTLVRVVGRWPDFIFYTGDGCYAFVESKAFIDAKSALPLEAVDGRVLGDGLVKAVVQLNADPFVRVWYCFTQICEISPTMRLRVTLLKLDAPGRKRESLTCRVLPDVIVRSLARQAIEHAVANPELEAAILDVVSQTGGKTDSATRPFVGKTRRNRNATTREKENADVLLRQIVQAAKDGLEQVLSLAAPDELLGDLRRSVEVAIEEESRELSITSEISGSRFAVAKARASQGKLARLRPYGNEHILLADLPLAQREALTLKWKSDWETASRPLDLLSGNELWRCGSVAVCLGQSTLDGLSLL